MRRGIPEFMGAGSDEGGFRMSAPGEGATEHPGIIPENEGEQGVVVMAAATGAAAAMATLTTAGRDVGLGSGFGHGVIGFEMETDAGDRPYRADGGTGRRTGSLGRMMAWSRAARRASMSDWMEDNNSGNGGRAGAGLGRPA